ncbi:MAG: peptidoglycan bridge formation glycyltransferase FemA/FemB family protein [Spirochaetales bacterium]|nr:peptidoglycan bridge formation glycyltransferase FemA/FemB family protein [Spirochaetales bacterium]
MTSNRFLQTKFWAEFKSNHGWKNLIVFVDEDKNVSLFQENNDAQKEGLAVCVLLRSFSLKVKRFTIAYIPMAFELKENDISQLPEKDALNKLSSYFSQLGDFCKRLKNFLPENTICIRFDPPVDFYSFEKRDLICSLLSSVLKKQKIPFVRSSVAIQPPDTTVLNLSLTEEEILSNMKNKWRYNIRLASKKGVAVEKYTAEDENFETAFENFFRLFEITSKRDSVSFHNKEYYIDLLEKSAADRKKDKNAPKVQLYLARSENDYLAGIITLFFKGEAVYLYGASGNVKRNYMSAYLLQWTAIQDAKKEGCPFYDFYGMPPSDDENHPMHGLYLFKTGFGGKNIHRIGSWDFPVKKNWYKLYTCAEKIRSWVHKVLVKKLAGFSRK